MKRLLTICLLALAFTACQHAPAPGYADTPEVLEKRSQLTQDLLALLPLDDQELPGARREARWLADTAYKASAGIATVNDPVFMNWLNNRLVNSVFNLQERGLCWHYQQDMYRELRRRKLQYFRIGCCVRDRGEGSEHNCVYLAAANTNWPHALILDPWLKNGRLITLKERDFRDDDWQDALWSVEFLSAIYPENHRYPIEHWAQVKSGEAWNHYIPSWTPEGVTSRQGQIMIRNMEKGLQERGGKLTNY